MTRIKSHGSIERVISGGVAGELRLHRYGRCAEPRARAIIRLRDPIIRETECGETSGESRLEREREEQRISEPGSRRGVEERVQSLTVRSRRQRGVQRRIGCDSTAIREFIQVSKNVNCTSTHAPPGPGGTGSGNARAGARCGDPRDRPGGRTTPSTDNPVTGHTPPRRGRRGRAATAEAASAEPARPLPAPRPGRVPLPRVPGRGGARPAGGTRRGRRAYRFGTPSYAPLSRSSVEPAGCTDGESLGGAGRAQTDRVGV